MLKMLVADLMQALSERTKDARKLPAILGVTQILLVDSSSISLWDGSKEEFPGTWTTAGIKWHACFDLLTGVMTWFELTPSSTNDRKCFPNVESLKGKLIIFDLGYWDYRLLKAIDSVRGYFLSRLKSNSQVVIEKVVNGVSEKLVGSKLLDQSFKRKRDSVLEVIGSVTHDGEQLTYRVVGFWNTSNKCYHWYITNLKIPAYLLYPLYRLRWQIELIFKACKTSLNANQLTSNSKNIIENLLLSSLIAHLLSTTILQMGSANLNNKQTMAVSFQRNAKIAVHLASDFINFFTKSSKHFLVTLTNKIQLFAQELFDPNYNNRSTTMRNVVALASQLG